MRIAVLEAEASQLDLIRKSIAGIGHECHVFADGKTLLRELHEQNYDLLILDWSLPEVQCPPMVRWIRDHLSIRLPILFVTHRREEPDMVERLGTAGADDYVVKPIRVGELETRVSALLRRFYPAQKQKEICFGRYRFLPATHELRVDGKLVVLKHREYELALFLFQNLGRMLSREHLRESVWGADADAPSRSLDTHISRLRTKLELRPANGFLLSAIYGLGYRLEAIEAGALASASSTASATKTAA